MLALAGCIAAAVTPRVVFAEETNTANETSARKHFEKARMLYGKGSYREAIVELEAAHALDSNAKDLVFNLGVVHEKLADIDDALKWFRMYTTMDLTGQERDRAGAYIRRLEGAKREADEKAAQQPPLPESTPPTTGPGEQQPGSTQSPSRPKPRPGSSSSAPAGRVDKLTVGAASVSAAALVFGVVMAVIAQQEKPSSNFVTGRDGTVQDLQNQVDKAYRNAILADIGFGVALVSGVATAYLYFGRSRAAPAPTSSMTVSARPLFGGGALLIKGSF
jgi:tetratricopeptide (TPR) repeat protein